MGGGSVPNDERHTLARIPLRWMVRQCFLTNTGIKFHADLLRKIGMNPDTLYPAVKDRPDAIYAPVFKSLGDHPEKTGDNTERPKREEKEAKGTDKTLRMSTLKFSSFKVTLPRSWTTPQSHKSGKLRKRARSGRGSALGASCSGTSTGLGDISATVSSSVSSAMIAPALPSSKVLTEEEEDLADALSPIYDQLTRKKAWWTLELIPMRHRVQGDDNNWGTEVSCVYYLDH